MKQLFIFLILFVIVIIIILVLITLLRMPISKGKILQPARLWVQIFCPPKDLFDLVVNKKIDLSKLNDSQLFTFTVKYVGSYKGGILVDMMGDDFYNYDLKLRMKLNFYKEGALLITKETTNDRIPFYGKRGNGFILFEFSCPEDIPIDTEIRCELTVLTVDKALDRQYGSVRLYIQKVSEE